MRWKTLAVLLLVTMFMNSAMFGNDLEGVRSLVKDGESTKALVQLDEHLETFPVDPEAMFLRGLLLAEAQREGEAREVFEDVAGLRPDRPEPLNNLAVIKAAMGDYDEAVEILKEALRTHPAYRTAYENLTKIYGQLASEAYSRALSVDGAHDRSSLELVLLSEMVLPQVETVEVAEAPSQPLPAVRRDSVAMAERDADEEQVDGDDISAQVGEMEMAEKVAESSSADEGAPTSPDRAIEDAMRHGRDLTAAPTDVENEAMAEVPAEPMAEVPAEPLAEAPAEPLAESVDETPMEEPAAPVSPEPAELASLVEDWARAWSEQNVDDYLSFYSQDFLPTGDMTREDWKSLRRARLAAPSYVKVSVAFLDFETGEADQAVVRFNQSYESDTFSDVVTKTLELVREGGVWKISRESVDS